MANITLSLSLLDGVGTGNMKCTGRGQSVIITKVARSYVASKALTPITDPYVYITVGPDYFSVGSKTPNGEEHFLPESLDHDENWQCCYIVTSSLENELNLGYLQHELWAVAKQSRHKVIDPESPPAVILSAEEQTVQDKVIKRVELCLSTLGSDLFVPGSIKDQNKSIFGKPKKEGTIFHLERKDKGIHALMKVKDGKFTVLKGSLICASPSSTLRPYSKRLRSLAKESDRVLTENAEFYSPVFAGEFALGDDVLAENDWKAMDGTRLSVYATPSLAAKR